LVPGHVGQEHRDIRLYVVKVGRADRAAGPGTLDSTGIPAIPADPARFISARTAQNNFEVTQRLGPLKINRDQGPAKIESMQVGVIYTRQYRAAHQINAT
jgi:hypothetical protein